MKKHLLRYLETKNILNPMQFGFRQNRNTFMPLNIFSNDVYSAIDNKLSVLSIFVDFAKAFDTVNHEILINKMQHYGIRGPILSWIKDYLTDINIFYLRAKNLLLHLLLLAFLREVFWDPYYF